MTKIVEKIYFSFGACKILNSHKHFHIELFLQKQHRLPQVHGTIFLLPSFFSSSILNHNFMLCSRHVVGNIWSNIKSLYLLQHFSCHSNYHFHMSTYHIHFTILILLLLKDLTQKLFSMLVILVALLDSDS